MNLRASAAVAALSLSFGLIVPPPPAPVSAEHPGEPPTVTADAWILYDATADVVLAGTAIDEERAMASVTKIMTALVARQHLDLEAEVRISDTAAGAGESEVGLVAGERWTVRDLFYALLVRSGNDAAIALAEATAGSVSDFAGLMNQKAEELGLVHSHFVNAHGLDDPDHYTTAHDLAVMARELLEDPLLAQMVRTRVVVFKPSPNGANRNMRNTNHLLGVFPGVVGVKTGYTGNAGLVLVSALHTPSRTLVGVVLGSDAHFDDSRALLDYGTRLITLEDRWLRPLLVEAGGGGAGVTGFDDAARSRLLAVQDLPAGTGQVTDDISDTAVGRAIARRLRSTLPEVLGGQG
jgi:serine-type D-Ala-D-Ala carboxypeptidase (penicillin-binding protein 5/6)